MKNKLRKQHNLRVLRDLRTTSYCNPNIEDSWYPKRPAVKKDIGAIRKLYGSNIRVVERKSEDEN